MTLVDELVDKYMGILGIRGKKPIIEVTSRLSANWLGRDKWSAIIPDTTRLELQKSLLTMPRTLERVVAHEMIHHRDFLALTEDQRFRIKMGLFLDSHGASFKQGMAFINRIMGPDFVTERSDKGYEQAPPEKDIYVLIMPMSEHRLSGDFGYAWAARLTPEATAVIAKKAAEGARLVRSRDRRWTDGKAKIRRFGGLVVPRRGTELATELRRLYESAKS